MVVRNSLVDLRSSWMFLARSFESSSLSGSICGRVWCVWVQLIQKNVEEIIFTK
jgi:hypothetical protein